MQAAIDRNVIESLRQLDKPGGRSFVSEMIDIFSEDTPERLQALRDGVAAGDAATVSDVAHAMKGSCSNFGAHRMESLCRELERAARDGDLDGAAARVDAIDAEYQRVLAALAEYR